MAVLFWNSCWLPHRLDQVSNLHASSFWAFADLTMTDFSFLKHLPCPDTTLLTNGAFPCVSEATNPFTSGYFRRCHFLLLGYPFFFFPSSPRKFLFILVLSTVIPPARVGGSLYRSPMVARSSLRSTRPSFVIICVFSFVPSIGLWTLWQLVQPGIPWESHNDFWMIESSYI